MDKLNLKLHQLSVNEDGKVMNFSAVAGYIGVPTDQTPSTSNHGWKVVLDQESAKNAINGLVGMGVNVNWKGRKEFSAHDTHFKVGVIDNASIEDNKILCSGHLWRADFPDVCEAIKESKDFMGASVELCASNVESDEKNKIQTLKDFAFTGLSIVYKNKAAFMKTNFMCSVLEDNELTEEEIKNLLETHQKAAEASFDAKLVELSTKVEKTITDAITGVKTELAAKAEEKVPEKEPKKAPEEVNLSAEDVAKVVKEQVAGALKEAIAGVKSELSAKEQKKSAPDFSSFSRYGENKSYMQLSAEIDKDSALTDAQKWSAKMDLWSKARQAGVVE